MEKITILQKREIEKQVGKDLVKRLGKKKFYPAEEVKKSCRNSKIYDTLDCWALSFFCDAESFNAYHKAIGETCNYMGMRGQMMMAVLKKPVVDAPESIEVSEDLIEGAADFTFDISLSWLDLEEVLPESFFDLFDFFDIDIF